MKQGFVKFFAVLALMIVSVFAITACGEEDVQPPVTYAVTYVKGADEATGEAPASAQKEEGAKFNLPANPFTYTGYEFAGWSDGAQTYAANAEYTMPAKAVTFTAQWNSTQPSVTYAVTYAKGADEATGEAPASVQKAQGEKFNLPANPFTYAGHEFTGWSDGAQTYAANAEYTMPAKAVAFTAQWAALHTVTVDPNNGEEPAEYTVRNGEKFTAVLETPVHPDGKTFRYWAANGSEYNFDKAVTGDIELTAEYAWKITFNAGEGASGTVEPQWVKIWMPNRPIVLPGGTGLSNLGKAFAGWNDGNQTYAAGESYVGSGNVTFTAVWNDDDTDYNVTFYSGSFSGVTGENPSDMTKKAGETIVLPQNPYTKPHHTFAGWKFQRYLEESWVDIDNTVVQAGGSYAMPAYNIRITALWDANRVTVIYDKNDGAATGSMANGSGVFGKSFTLPTECGYSNGNKIFNGWAYEANGAAITTKSISLNASRVSDDDTITLYVCWLAPAVFDFDDLIGTWSNGSNTLSLVKTGQDTGAAVLNGKEFLTVIKEQNAFYAISSDYVLYYTVTATETSLTFTSEGSAVITFNQKSAIANAPVSDFTGKWSQPVGTSGTTTRNWVVTENGAYYGANASEASVTVVGNYVVLSYEDANYYCYCFILTKGANALTGYYKAPEKESTEITFTQTNAFLVLSVNGEFNQMVNSGSVPNSEKLVEPAAPSGQEFDKWVYVSGETEFDPTAAMTADANIKAAFKDKAGAENTVDFAGSYTASGLLGTSVTFTKFSVDFDGMQVTYTLANGTAKTVALTDESSSPYKPSDLGSDAFYFSVVMETKSYYLLIAQNKSSLLLCNQDDEVLQGGNFSVQTSSGDWVSLTVAEGSEFYNLAAAGTKYYFAESFENTGTTFIGIQFYKSSLGVGVKTIYLSNGAEKVLTSTISYSANDGNQLVFSSSAYIIRIGKKSDGKYYITSFSYKNNVDSTERVLLTEKP